MLLKQLMKQKLMKHNSAKAQINSGKGTKDNPIDIYNAVAYARPGQKDSSSLMEIIR